MTTPEREALIAQLRASGIPNWALARELMTQAADMLAADAREREAIAAPDTYLALRADAGRYRMIKEKHWMEPGLEATIDAAIKEGAK